MNDICAKAKRHMIMLRMIIFRTLYHYYDVIYGEKVTVANSPRRRAYDEKVTLYKLANAPCLRQAGEKAINYSR